MHGTSVDRKRVRGRFAPELDSNVAARLARLPLIDFVQWLLDNGRYDIDAETGTVTNLISGKALKPTPGRDGYPFVTLTYSKVQRPVRVHRFVAVKVWGAVACAGKDAAHLDGSRDRSVVANVSLKTRQEHIAYDGTAIRTKESWPACRDCGDPDGPVRRGKRTPERISGQRFGLDGRVCCRCYSRLYKRWRRAAA